MGLFSLVDLPDALLEVIFGFIPHDRTRCRLATTCTSARQLYSTLRQRTLICSMYLLLQRTRFCDVPHWTMDVMAIMRLMHRPIFKELQNVHLLVDAPCLEAEASCVLSPAYVRYIANTTGLASVRVLCVNVVRRHYSRPAPQAVQRLLEFMPELRSLTLMNIRNIGSDLLQHMLRRDQPLEHLSLQGCAFTPSARRVLINYLTNQRGQAVHTTVEDRYCWPRLLTSLDLNGDHGACIMRSVADILDDQPMSLPPKLIRLDMHDWIEHLHGVQLIITLLFTAALRELVISSARKHSHVISLLATYRQSMFPNLKVSVCV